MLAYIYHAIFTVGGREARGLLILKYSPLAAKILLLSWENGGKVFNKQCSFKMYITMKYQFILHDWNLVRVTSNQLSLPMFQAP